MVMIDMDIPEHGCSSCPIMHKEFNGIEVISVCSILDVDVPDNGIRPMWCPLKEIKETHTVAERV